MKLFGWMVMVFAGIALMSLTYKKKDWVGSKPAPDTLGKKTGFITVEPFFTVNAAMKSRVAIKGIAGFSRTGRPIEAYYFPGNGNKRAMVIGGVHGSELSAVEVAKRLIAQLNEDQLNYYSVIVIPALFVDNIHRAVSNVAAIGSTSNIGRYSQADAADPNRQMPALGTAFDENNPFDLAGRLIEPENQLLLRFIQEFRPQRIVNLHAIRAVEHAGIYADPRTDSKGNALDYTSDSSLAIDMAKFIEERDGIVPGNQLQTKPSALYYCDPPVALRGTKQRRNLTGSALPGNRGHGVSLGSWASTAVEDPYHPSLDRPAIRLITVEFPGYKRSSDYSNPRERRFIHFLTDLYAAAINKVFLGHFHEETEEQALPLSQY